MGLEEELADEIRRWAEKLDEALRATTARDEKGEEMLTNVKAYRSDSAHFLGRGDLIRSFECLIWGWAWLEIGKSLGHLRAR